MINLFSFLMVLCAAFFGSTLVASEFALNSNYKVDTVWATTFQTTVTLKNPTNTPTSSWTATFSMPQGYVLSTHVSSGVFTVNGQNVTVNNLSGNGAIPAVGSTTFQMMINMPRGAPTIINNLQAVANGASQPPPPPPPPPPVGGSIEHSVWYIDWTSWFPGPTFVLPSGVNMINVFVGTMTTGMDGQPTLDGFGNLTPELSAFTAYCAAQNPPIAVKVSIGGSGGMYDRCWDFLTSDNIQSVAQGMVNFCHAHGLVGVDFDYEEYASTDQEHLVGLLIKAFKILDPNLQTSLCTNAGFGPNFPWQQVVQTILDAATVAPGHNAVDRMYIMSYYNPMSDEQNWILGWASWLEATYGFTPARVSVGIDDFDAHAYDPVAFAAWAASMGFSTAHWAFDPARP